MDSTASSKAQRAKRRSMMSCARSRDLMHDSTIELVSAALCPRCCCCCPAAEELSAVRTPEGGLSGRKKGGGEARWGVIRFLLRLVACSSRSRCVDSALWSDPARPDARRKRKEKDWPVAHSLIQSTIRSPISFASFHSTTHTPLNPFDHTTSKGQTGSHGVGLGSGGAASQSARVSQRGPSRPQPVETREAVGCDCRQEHATLMHTLTHFTLTHSHTHEDTRRQAKHGGAARRSQRGSRRRSCCPTCFSLPASPSPSLSAFVLPPSPPCRCAAPPSSSSPHRRCCSPPHCHSSPQTTTSTCRSTRPEDIAPLSAETVSRPATTAAQPLTQLEWRAAKARAHRLEHMPRNADSCLL